MKSLISLTLLLTGCATQPLTFEQRMQVMHAMQQQPHYYLPQPQILQIPQYQPPPVIPSQPIQYSNPTQTAVTTPMPQPQRPAAYTLSDCKTTPMGTLLCQQR
jgi:hypothetical protein